MGRADLRQGERKGRAEDIRESLRTASPSESQLLMASHA
jgi:hypothetical protein